VCSPKHLQKASALRGLLAAYRASEDLVRIGAYQKGNDAELDTALALLPAVELFLRQKPDDSASFEQTCAQLLALGG
jgi:flagellum-specific ATP synthase